MEYGENVAYWMEQKVEYVATFTKIDVRLKKLDSAAVNGVAKIEDTHNNVSIHHWLEIYWDVKERLINTFEFCNKICLP